jgi:hypothetical protein
VLLILILEVLMLSYIVGGLGAAALLTVLPCSMHAQEKAAMTTPPSREATFSGTVIDVSCKFGQGLSGPDHRMCAEVCADKGIPLAILGDDGVLYLPTSAGMPGDGQNPRLRTIFESARGGRGPDRPTLSRVGGDASSALPGSQTPGPLLPHLGRTRTADSRACP